jgi:hypothetical protein
MTFPIIDLHADLFAYLAFDDQRSPYDSDSNSYLINIEISQVAIQVLPIFMQTGKNSYDFISHLNHIESLGG